MPTVSIPAERVFNLFGFPITNTLLASWVTMLVLIVIFFFATRPIRRLGDLSQASASDLVPAGRLQAAAETIIEGFYHMVEDVAGPHWARQFFPVVMTIFLFVVTSNWLGLTPLYGGWGVLEHPHEGPGYEVKWAGPIGLLTPTKIEASEGHSGEEAGKGYILAPMFRSAATDLNVTLALAIVSVIMTQYFGLKAAGFPYFGKFINLGFLKAFTIREKIGCIGRVARLGMGLIDGFVGILELISEFSRIISFSFRLFGNIFAGEVLLGVMGFLIPFVVSLPFYGLELLVGVVQALIFMMLTVAFFNIATVGHGEGEH